MSDDNEKPKGKLTYCANCKKSTETIIIGRSYIFGLFGEQSRICRICAKPKRRAVLEMEEEY